MQWFLRSGGLKFCCQGAILGRHVGFADTKMFSGSRRHAQWVCFRMIPRDTSRAILAAFTRVVRTSAYYNSGNFRSPDGAKSHLTRFIYVSLLTQNCKSKLNRKREKRKKLIWSPFIKYQISHTSGHNMQIPTPGMDFARKNT